MSENSLIWLLIPLGALLAVIFGGMLIRRLQKKLREPLFPSGPEPTGWGTSTTFEQGAAETREDCVRRHHNRPGVVANGETLRDLHDRIRRLEQRIAALESDRDEESQGLRGPRP